MSKTPNYNLYLTDDSSTQFREWREQMNGTEDSNMMKIDAALGDMAHKSVVVNKTLSSENWVGSAAPYTQQLTVDGLGEDTNGIIRVSEDAGAAEIKAAQDAVMTIAAQSSGTLTISAAGVKPNIGIPVSIMIFG